MSLPHSFLINPHVLVFHAFPICSAPQAFQLQAIPISPPYPNGALVLSEIRSISLETIDKNGQGPPNSNS